MPTEVRELIVVRLVERVFAATEHERPSKGAEAGGDMNWARAGEVEDTEFGEPTLRIPFPVGEATR